MENHDNDTETWDEKFGVQIFFVLVFLVAAGLAWLAFDPSRTPKNAGFLQMSTMTISALLAIPAAISTASLVRGILGFSWFSMFVWVLMPLFAGSCSVMLTATDGW